MKRLCSLLVAVVAAGLVGVGCGRKGGPPRCECPGCDREGTKAALYGDDFARRPDAGAALGKTTTVWLCPEHYDKAPDSWPGEFLPVGRSQRDRLAFEKAQEARAVEEKNLAEKRAAWERALPENSLERSGGNSRSSPASPARPAAARRSRSSSPTPAARRSTSAN